MEHIQFRAGQNIRLLNGVETMILATLQSSPSPTHLSCGYKYNVLKCVHTVFIGSSLLTGDVTSYVVVAISETT